MDFSLLEFPHASIQRIVKSALPSQVHVSKEVRTSFQRAAGLFILYLTNAAQDIARAQKRQTIQGEDVIAALEEIELDQFCDPCVNLLAQVRRGRKGKAGKADSPAQKPKPKPAGESEPPGAEDSLKKRPRKSREEKQAEREAAMIESLSKKTEGENGEKKKRGRKKKSETIAAENENSPYMKDNNAEQGPNVSLDPSVDLDESIHSSPSKKQRFDESHNNVNNENHDMNNEQPPSETAPNTNSRNS